NDSVSAPSLNNVSVPLELDELVLWATAKNPDDRPANAGELLSALKEVRAQVVPQSPLSQDQTMVLEPATELLPPVTQDTEIIPERIVKASPVRTTTGVLENRTKKRNR